MADEQPGDNGRACPPWCIVQHDDQHALDDLVHEGEHREAPAVTLVRYRDQQNGAPHRQAVSTALSVVRYRYDCDDEEWIYVGDGRSGLDLSPESAQRLARALATLLDSTQASPDDA